MSTSLSGTYLGEDVPLVVTYEDDSGSAVDPDDTDGDGTPNATITIRPQGSDTAVVTDAAMTHNGTGELEYVWDTDVDADGTGSYQVDVAADFNGETKITRMQISLR